MTVMRDTRCLSTGRMASDDACTYRTERDAAIAHAGLRDDRRR
jgi:hypothetical protein